LILKKGGSSPSFFFGGKMSKLDERKKILEYLLKNYSRSRTSDKVSGINEFTVSDKIREKILIAKLIANKRAARIQTAVSIAAAITLAVAVEWSSPTLVLFYHAYLEPALARFWWNIIGVIIVFIVGFGLYHFKRWSKLVYGIVEVAFALFAGWQGITKTSASGWGEVITVVAAVYLVVRGMDNIYTSIDERRLQKELEETDHASEEINEHSYRHPN